MTSPSVLADQLDRLARRQRDDKLATAMTAMSCALLGAMVYRELKPIFREMDPGGKLKEIRRARSF